MPLHSVNPSPEIKHPACPACSVPMWLVRVAEGVGPDRTQDRLHFECKACGATAIIPAL